MHELSDSELLVEYVERGNESAFREIVTRHADLIYSSALRQVTFPDLAQDVAQSVFTDLARKAKSLTRTIQGNAALLGWLYRSTRFAALNQLREDRLRREREQASMEQFDRSSETELDWESIRESGIVAATGRNLRPIARRERTSLERHLQSEKFSVITRTISKSHPIAR